MFPIKCTWTEVEKNKRSRKQDGEVITTQVKERGLKGEKEKSSLG